MTLEVEYLENLELDFKKVVVMNLSVLLFLAHFIGYLHLHGYLANIQIWHLIATGPPDLTAS